MTHATRPTPTRPNARRRGFTLVEILIVISIIVLMLGLALPAFRAITGSRSVEGATNTVSALLARARTDAVGIQQPRGVAFYTDVTGQCRMAEVGPAPFVNWAGPNTAYARGTYATVPGIDAATGRPVTYYAVCIKDILANSAVPFPKPSLIGVIPASDFWHLFVDKNNKGEPPANPATSTDPTFVDSELYFACLGIYYDVLPDIDPIPLPLGVGAQVVTDAAVPATGAGAGVRSSDGYLRAGAIVFDAAGRVAFLRPGFVFSARGLIGTAVALNNTVGSSDVAFNNARMPNPPRPIYTAAGQMIPPYYPLPQPLPSSVGLVVYDRDAYATQGFPMKDPTFVSGDDYNTPPANVARSESDAEAWLDANATPLLLNRYNGTLVRGE